MREILAMFLISPFAFTLLVMFLYLFTKDDSEESFGAAVFVACFGVLAFWGLAILFKVI